MTIRSDSLLLKVCHRHKHTRENSGKSERRHGFKKTGGEELPEEEGLSTFTRSTVGVKLW